MSSHTVNIHEAKTHFSKLLEQVGHGEEIVIAKAGRPIAKLVAYNPDENRVRPPGSLKGQIRLAPDFDAPLPDELLAAFEGKE
jgi:prevent-host-death family protein